MVQVLMMPGKKKIRNFVCISLKLFSWGFGKSFQNTKKIVNEKSLEKLKCCF